MSCPTPSSTPSRTDPPSVRHVLGRGRYESQVPSSCPPVTARRGVRTSRPFHVVLLVLALRTHELYRRTTHPELQSDLPSYTSVLPRCRTPCALPYFLTSGFTHSPHPGPPDVPTQPLVRPVSSRLPTGLLTGRQHPTLDSSESIDLTLGDELGSPTLPVTDVGEPSVPQEQRRVGPVSPTFGVLKGIGNTHTDRRWTFCHSYERTRKEHFQVIPRPTSPST